MGGMLEAWTGLKKRWVPKADFIGKILGGEVLFMHKRYLKKFQCLCVLILVEMVFSLIGCARVSERDKAIRNQYVDNMANEELREKLLSRLAVMGKDGVPQGEFPIRKELPPRPSPEVSSERAPFALVNSIMALLATFETANILPPEGTPQANQLIHGLIQLQTALVKSQSELNEYASAAIAQIIERENHENLQPIHQNGLTSKILEALLLYDKKKPMWNQPAIVRTLQNYNVSRSDWLLIVNIFARADEAFRNEGTSIHKIYEQWLSQMQGNR